MTYPKAPWTLQGYALQTCQLLDAKKVRPFIPPQFELVCVLPGKTVGGIYVSHYGTGSVLEYSELIVIAGLVSYSGQIGGWVSHIYVDNADSVAGGRNIWGLPKELAEFTWEKQNFANTEYKNRLLVRQQERTLCQFSYNPPNFELQVPLSANAFSTKSDSILLFKSHFESHMSLIATQLQVPTESPFASLGLDHPWLTLCWNQLRLVVGSPEAVGLREPVVSQL
ncbi:acetoacetate decarboxylase family protein [Allocoleopsis franciscana]|uniref:Acetoacetate decarboxylase n=1 Tax=Allocoleopsis franciscana PCC 7113 TaxID=1173027 RepID=K9WC43_9CYAN|nr:acetoacetate decarboxylase family protein [Allocoleopsis franciscana]AFZ17381.1 acetoacetate decarboxylase [Allocoleopsis franciscana PCC 7113]